MRNTLCLAGCPHNLNHNRTRNRLPLGPSLSSEVGCWWNGDVSTPSRYPPYGVIGTSLDMTGEIFASWVASSVGPQVRGPWKDSVIPSVVACPAPASRCGPARLATNRNNTLLITVAHADPATGNFDQLHTLIGAAHVDQLTIHQC